MGKLTLEQRLEIYQEAKDCVINHISQDDYSLNGGPLYEVKTIIGTDTVGGLCPLFEYIFERKHKDLNNSNNWTYFNWIMRRQLLEDEFPEFLEYMPKDQKFGDLWFDHEKRVEVITEIVERVERIVNNEKA